MAPQLAPVSSSEFHGNYYEGGEEASLFCRLRPSSQREAQVFVAAKLSVILHGPLTPDAPEVVLRHAPFLIEFLKKATYLLVL
jgi:hypothetical protein